MMDSTLTMSRPTNTIFAAQSQPYAPKSTSTMEIADVDMSDTSMNEESLHPDTGGAYSAKSSQRTSETSLGSGTQNLELEPLVEKNANLMPAVDLLAEAERLKESETPVLPQQGQKRFANGHVKTNSMMSLSTAGQIDKLANARIKNSPSLYEGKSTKEMANSFQLRVQYLMKKRELGWEDKSFEEVEQLVQQGLHNSPRRRPSLDRTASRGSLPSSTTSNRLQSIQQTEPARYTSHRQQQSTSTLQPPVQLDDPMQISPDLRQQNTPTFDPRRQGPYPRTPTLGQHENQGTTSLADEATAQEKDAAEMLIFMRSPGTFSQPVRQDPISPKRNVEPYPSSQPTPVQYQHRHERQLGHIRTSSVHAQADLRELERGRPMTSLRTTDPVLRSPLTPRRAQAHSRGMSSQVQHHTSTSPRKSTLTAQLGTSAQIDATLDRMADAERQRARIKRSSRSDSSFSDDEYSILQSRDMYERSETTRSVEFGPRLKRESGGSSASDD